MHTHRWAVALVLSAALFAISADAGTQDIEKLRRQAEAGDPKAQVQLGNAYYVGTFVLKDYAEAARWFKKAAEQGYAGAQTRLGGMYENGLGVELDQDMAAYWYSKAAEQGYPGAAEAAQRLRVARRVLSLPNPDALAARLTAPRTVALENVDNPGTVGGRNPHAYAVIIAAERYRAPIPQVPFALNDAAVMRDYFERVLGIATEHITGVANPSLGDLRVAVSWLRNQAKADATSEPLLLLYYAGHGVPDAATGKPYLLPVDARPEYVEETGYPIATLIADLGEMPGRSVLILDACFSGTAARSSESNAGLMGGKRPAFIDTALPSNSKVIVLSAVTGAQTSNALPEAQHGLFTYFLLKGLRGDAADAQGQITVSGLYDYVQKEVSAAATRMNQVQTPTLSPGADVVVVRRSK